MSQSTIWPSGQTRIAAVIGWPARYSLSPALHNAAYRAMGFDAVYVVLPVEPEHLADAIPAVRAFGFLGASVTIPHKEAVISFLDELTPEARRLQAVNCIHRDGTRLVGHNTDGAGFVASLKADCAFDPLGARCVVIGAGGAARAIVAALGASGAAEVVVINRSTERGKQTAQLAGAVGRYAGSTSEFKELATADLIVNATPIGMEGVHPGELPIDVADIHNEQTVVDIVYHPPVTPFLEEAKNRGATTTNGLGMLIHQAAAQIELWTGQAPPIDVMRASVMAT